MRAHRLYSLNIILPLFQQTVDTYSNHFWDDMAEQVKAQAIKDTILVVEDCVMQQKFISKVVRDKLEEFKLPETCIIECQTGALAEVIAKQQRKESKLRLIILDLTLSDMSGLDLIEKLPSDVAVVIVSASSDNWLKGKIISYPNVFKLIQKGSEFTVQDKKDIEQILYFVFSKIMMEIK